VRDIFSLIDIDRNGVFTERDLERFLGQVLEGDAGGDAAEEAKEIVEVTRRYENMCNLGYLWRLM
jgi:hypothetical protein